MDKVIEKLTVYFEEPFLVGVFEHIENGKLSVENSDRENPLGC